MDKTGIVTITRKPGDPLPDTGTDWTKIAALTPEQIHAAALSDPDAQPLPRDGRGLIKLVNVKKLRESLGMTQESFADTYDIPVDTLREWEQRSKNPDARLRDYLRLIAQSPNAMAELVKGTRLASLWTASLRRPKQ